jgi:ammonia channel protein AmtB
LGQLGFHDFAGVAIIHVTGGCAGLCGTIILGERYGKDKDRKAKEKHN